MRNVADNAQALLDLDKDGALVPHGIGGHARTIITEFIAEHVGLTARIAALEKAQQDSSSALEAIVLEALGPYGEELTIGQRRMLADVIAREFRARTTLEASERGGGE